MPSARLNVLHAIHDFLPAHQAGSEIYAFDLGRELSRRHHVTVLCADYDPHRQHGEVTWRVHQGLPVVELVNNWVCTSFADTYRPPLIGDRIGHVLDVVRPDIVHVHNLMNLSFDLPVAARARGIPLVATLHDYTLVCPSGGQRVHRAEEHLCHEIDTERCARCFTQSPFHLQMSAGRVAAMTGKAGMVQRAAIAVHRRLPALAGRLAGVARQAVRPPVMAADIGRRLEAAREVLGAFDRIVAPSPSIATEFEKLGVDPSILRVSDYGTRAFRTERRDAGDTTLRIGYAGTLVWHKGVHVAIESLHHLPPASCELRIFGDPRVAPDYTRDLEARAAGLPVRFMGTFGRDAVADVYAGIDVLVVPSLWLENSPLVIHEAFTAGVPVVGSRIGGIADLVRHGWNGLLVDPASPASLAAALHRLVDRPGLVAELAARLPAVKSIEDDARGWEVEYARVIEARTAGELTA